MNFHQKPITFIGQVDLKVQNLARSLEFYQKIIGFKVLIQTEKSAELTVDGKTVLLSIHQPDGVVAKQEKTTGLYHFALLLPKRSDLADIVQHFIKIGMQIGSADHLVSEALYLSDPDGNGIEIYVDRVPSTWKWQNGEVDMGVDPIDFPDLILEQTEVSWERLPVGTVMGHIHLHVSELQQTEKFYTEGLGFEVVNRYGSQALFLSDGLYHHHLGLNTWNGVGAQAPSFNSIGLASFTVMFPNEEKRMQIMEQLTAIGAPITKEKSTFKTIDPSGNQIYLHV